METSRAKTETDVQTEKINQNYMQNEWDKALIKMFNSIHLQWVLSVIWWPSFAWRIVRWPEHVLDQTIEENNKAKESMEEEKKSEISLAIDLDHRDISKETNLSEMFEASIKWLLTDLEVYHIDQKFNENLNVRRQESDCSDEKMDPPQSDKNSMDWNNSNLCSPIKKF